MSRKAKTQFLITGALIAAAYAGLTYLSNAFGLAYGPIQLRISEALTLLPVFTPAAIPGLAVGCFISNIGSFNLLDLIFGTAATLISAVMTYYLRDVKWKGLPLLALLPPVIVNALIIGLEIAIFFLPKGYSFWGFVVSGLQVGVSEALVCYVFGIPFYMAVRKYRIFENKK